MAIQGPAVVAVGLLAALSVPSFLAAAPPGQQQIKQEPVLNFDVTGGTLLGPLHTRFTVYNNGLVTFSEASGFADSSSAGTTRVSDTVVDRLVKDLEDAGGFKLSDQTITVSDVPLTTVTVFRGDTNAKAHTFSYWLGIDQYAKIAQVIDDFYNAYVGGSI